MADRTALAARLAGLLNIAVDDAAMLSALDAAGEFVVLAENQPDPAPGGAVDALPDSALIAQGLVGFARAMYLDALASRGAAVALGDTTVDTVFTPEDIYRHWRHYFAHLSHVWGIA